MLYPHQIQALKDRGLSDLLDYLPSLIEKYRSPETSPMKSSKTAAFDYI